MTVENGYVSAEATVVTAKTGSLSVDVTFPGYTASSVAVASNLVRVGTIRVLPNIGLASDSSIDVYDSFTTTMENSYHNKNVKRFL